MSAPISAVHDLFINFENLINTKVRKRLLNDDFYVQHVSREPWPTGQGRQFTYPTYDRAGLTGGFLPFEPITPHGEGPTCDIPTVEAPNYAATIRAVTLWHAATNTPNICLTDLEYDWQITNQLEISVENMAEATRKHWAQELQRRYIDSCGNKLIYTPDTPTGTTWGLIEPTSGVDWALLDDIYSRLRHIAMPEDYCGTDEEGKVVLCAVGEYEVLDGLKSQDSNPNFYTNILGAAQGGNSAEQKTLLGSPGMPSGRAYRGWLFKTVQFAPRYDLIDGEWVQHYPWVAEQKTQGIGFEPNPAYFNAAYTDIAVFSNRVFKHLVPGAPRDRVGHNWDQKIDWLGAHRWKVLEHNKQTNPDQAYGYWRSTYAYGPQILRPDLGWTLRVKRCKTPLGTNNCPGFASL